MSIFSGDTQGKKNKDDMQQGPDKYRTNDTVNLDRPKSHVNATEHIEQEQWVQNYHPKSTVNSKAWYKLRPSRIYQVQRASSDEESSGTSEVMTLSTRASGTLRRNIYNNLYISTRYAYTIIKEGGYNPTCLYSVYYLYTR